MPQRLLPPFDAAECLRVLPAFLANYVKQAGATGVVLGLSGGIDSAVVAALAARAVGPERVLGLVLPHASSRAEDAEHAALVAEALGIATKTVDITPVTDAVLASLPEAEAARGLAAQNVKPRARMLVLYLHANHGNRLVLGTGNKSELLTGYFTKHGDGAADAYLIGDVYKTHVFELARALGIPDPIVSKPPTAGLWDGQTDEEELGISYAILDNILAGLESGLDDATIARRADCGEEVVRSIRARVARNAHKRLPLVIPKLGFRTPGLDWREARTRVVPGD